MSMIVLVPVELKSSMSAWETVATHKATNGYGVEFCTMRNRNGTTIVMRLFDEGREFNRLTVLEVSSTSIDNMASDRIHHRRVPKLVTMLMEEWVCEFIHDSHEFITWRSLMGENFEPRNSPLTEVKKENNIKVDSDKVTMSVIFFIPPDEEPVADETLDEDWATSFNAYLNSEEWKHDV